MGIVPQKTPQGKITLADYIQENFDAIRAVAANPVGIERLVAVVIGQVGQNPTLQRCTMESVYRAVHQAAQLGLEPGGALGECYLVPHGNVCTLIIGYRGYITLARQSKQIHSLQAWVVFDGDDFEVENGLHPILRHKPHFGTNDPNRIKFAYAVANMVDGSHQFDVMSRAEVDAIRNRSRAATGTSSPWHTDYAEMAKKTVLRRLVKYLPLSVETLEGVRIADTNEFDGMVVDSQTGEIIETTAPVTPQRALPASPPPSPRQSAPSPTRQTEPVELNPATVEASAPARVITQETPEQVEERQALGKRMLALCDQAFGGVENLMAWATEVLGRPVTGMRDLPSADRRTLIASLEKRLEAQKVLDTEAPAPARDESYDSTEPDDDDDPFADDTK